LCGLVGLGLLIAPLAALTAPVPEKASPVRPLLAKYCVSCHQGKTAAAGLNLAALAGPEKEAHAWELVAEKLRTGQMPPPGSPKPAAPQVKAAVAWVGAELRRVELAAPPDPGRVTARRLNRAEYNNSVRDLLGVDFKPADDFPQDDSGYGFDNIGDVLSLSPVLMEKYLTAAERVARTAVFGPEPVKPALIRSLRPDPEIPEIKAVPAVYDETGLSYPNAMHGVYRFPATGEYVARVTLGGSRPLGSEPAQAGIWVDGKQVATVVVDSEQGASFIGEEQNFSGKGAEVRIRVTAGDHWIAGSVLRMYEGLPAPYAGPRPSARVAPPVSALDPPANATPEEQAAFEKRAQARAKRAKEKRAVNQVRVRVMEFGGPHAQVLGPSDRSKRLLFTCGHASGSHVPACGRKIVADLARRAFRRPVSIAEIDRYAGPIALATREGDSFEEGVCLAVQAMLVSPHFLFRIEGPAVGAAKAAPQAVGQHALASRLSYFLWSSIPDAELSAAADRGLLARPAELERQVRRMLKDPKSTALVENFGGQWLELRKLESLKPDRERFPEFDDYLRLSMRRETELFFGEIVREDRSLLDFLDGRYTYLNEKLARHYGIAGVQGPAFRKVTLEGTPRGGVLTQASVLAVSSYSTRTSPVLRGRWILENLLNAPPPPPPPGVPNLDEAKVGASASLRKQLEVHRTNPTCASCHVRMDPLGFALENFNAIGAWRTRDGEFPIDSAGSLPDGRSFNGPNELRTVLKSDRAAFTDCLTEKLLTYALGRGLERYDRRTVKALAARVAANDYRFSSLVLEIVNSLPFRMRRGDAVK